MATIGPKDITMAQLHKAQQDHLNSGGQGFVMGNQQKVVESSAGKYPTEMRGIAPRTAAGGMNPNAYIDQLTEARKNQAIAGLEKSRQAALSQLNSEKAAIQPKYYDARNQTAASSQQSARNFAEYLAARGGTSSGTGAQAELTRGMTLQGNLGALGRQETAAYGDIERRTSDVQNAYQSDLAAAESGIQADRMNALLNDYYKNKERELQVAQLTGILNGQRTLSGQQFDRGVFESDRDYGRGVLESDRNFGFQQDQFNRGIFESDRDYSRGVLESDRTFNEGVRQFDKQFDRSIFESDRDYEFAKQKFQEDIRQFGVNAALERAAQSISRMNANTSAGNLALSRDEFNYRKDQDALSNQQEMANVSPYIDEFNSMYVSRNPSSGAVSVSNPTALRNAIIARGLSDAQTDQLLLYYGLPTG